MQFSLPTESFQAFEQARREGLGLSDDLRVEAKKTIGFLLKDLQPQADASLKSAQSIYGDLKSLIDANPYLNSIGGVHVGIEEYVEATLLTEYLEGKPLSTLGELGVTHEAYLAGLCDMSGELLRYARKKPDRMGQIESDLEELYQSCLGVIVTRNSLIRNKLEDLERNMKRLEEMIFQWELKHG